MSGGMNGLDPALELRMRCDAGKAPEEKEIGRMLAGSPLVVRLTETFEPKPFYAVWRLMALAEIPFAGRLAYAEAVRDYIERTMVTGVGFSPYGPADELMPCYNAMLLEAYAKLGWADRPAARQAVEWMKTYQLFERNGTSSWKGKGIKKHGGCLGTVPCYLDVAKSVKALAWYNRATQQADTEATKLAGRGMDYLLRHRLYKRLRDGQPINNHVLDLAFPPSYQLNMVELLEVAWVAGTIQRTECADALHHIQSQKTREGFWKINHVYKADGYVSFDRRGRKAEWLSYLLERYEQAGALGEQHQQAKGEQNGR